MKKIKRTTKTTKKTAAKRTARTVSTVTLTNVLGAIKGGTTTTLAIAKFTKLTPATVRLAIRTLAKEKKVLRYISGRSVYYVTSTSAAKADWKKAA